ncbi:MAG: HAD-IA family hydrolase, partial [Rhodovibrionaceae bacterium]
LALEVAISELLPLEARRHTPAVAQRYRDAALALRSSEAFHEPLFDGARDTLAQLDRPELCLGIATGKNLRGLQFSLQYHGLKEHFMTLHTPDTAPSKPHPAMVEHAMAACGCGPEETVVIGDTSFDMEMARAAKAGALGVSWGYHPVDRLQISGAQAIIKEFNELVPALQKLEEVSR